jgi:hypothetical protein
LPDGSLGLATITTNTSATPASSATALHNGSATTKAAETQATPTKTPAATPQGRPLTQSRPLMPDRETDAQLEEQLRSTLH